MVHEAGCWYQGVVCSVCGEEAALAMFHHHAPDLACFHGRTTHPAPLAVTLPVTREAAFVSPPIAVTFQVMPFIRWSDILTLRTVFRTAYSTCACVG